VVFLDGFQLFADPFLLGFFLRRWLGQVRLLRGKITDEQIEPAITIPVGDTDFRPCSAADIFRSVGSTRLFARRYELNGRSQLRGCGRSRVAVQRDTAVVGTNEQVKIAVAVPVGGTRPGSALDTKWPAAGLELLLLAKGV